MDDAQLQRYARHIMLDGIGIEGQQRLLDARVLVVGAGGLGSATAPYLAAAGVGAGSGTITLVDHDRVELSNLQRQLMHTHAQLGRSKVASGRDMMLALNPDSHVRTVEARADAALLASLVAEHDLVLDCTDNFVTRQAINAACVRAGVPLVSGAAVGYDGQVAVYDPRDDGGACYACVFAPDAPVADANCATLGVFAPAVALIGAVQVAETLKLLCEGRSSLHGKLMMLDARSMQWTTLAVARDPRCAVCGGAH